MTGPIEPPPSLWQFPDAEEADPSGLVAVGGDLEPGTVLEAYRQGLFPMPLGNRGPLGWWSPDPRAAIPLDGLVVSRSLRRSRRRFEVRIDGAFEQVIEACSDPSRPHGWITPAVRDAYVRLHELGWAHSVEAWALDDGRLAGGLYGVAIGGLFAGESMFHHRTDASKAALCGLVDLLRAEPDAGERLIDVQWLTDHLATLGAVEMDRRAYLRRLSSALARPVPRGLRVTAENSRL